MINTSNNRKHIHVLVILTLYITIHLHSVFRFRPCFCRLTMMLVVMSLVTLAYLSVFTDSDARQGLFAMTTQQSCDKILSNVLHFIFQVTLRSRPPLKKSIIHCHHLIILLSFLHIHQGILKLHLHISLYSVLCIYNIVFLV